MTDMKLLFLQLHIYLTVLLFMLPKFWGYNKKKDIKPYDIYNVSTRIDKKLLILMKFKLALPEMQHKIGNCVLY